MGILGSAPSSFSTRVQEDLESPSDEWDDGRVPKLGVGLAGIAHYVSVVTSIPASRPSPTTTENKIGILPLVASRWELMFRMVDVDNEAYHAGIVPGSILVKMQE